MQQVLQQTSWNAYALYGGWKFQHSLSKNVKNYWICPQRVNWEMKAQQRQVKVGDQAVLGLIIIFHLANYKHECKVIHQLAAYPLCVIYYMPSALAPLESCWNWGDLSWTSIMCSGVRHLRESMYPGNRTKCKMAAVRFPKLPDILLRQSCNSHAASFSQMELPYL